SHTKVCDNLTAVKLVAIRRERAASGQSAVVILGVGSDRLIKSADIQDRATSYGDSGNSRESACPAQGQSAAVDMDHRRRRRAVQSCRIALLFQDSRAQVGIHRSPLESVAGSG